MLKLMPVTDREALELYAAVYNVPVDEGLCLTIADQRGECLGVCFYHFTPEGMQIEYADANGDGDLFDGLLRASMAALMDKPEDTVTFSDRVDHEPVSYTHLTALICRLFKKPMRFFTRTSPSSRRFLR